MERNLMIGRIHNAESFGEFRSFAYSHLLKNGESIHIALHDHDPSAVHVKANHKIGNMRVILLTTALRAFRCGYTTAMTESGTELQDVRI